MCIVCHYQTLVVTPCICWYPILYHCVYIALERLYASYGKYTFDIVLGLLERLVN